MGKAILPEPQLIPRFSSAGFLNAKIRVSPLSILVTRYGIETDRGMVLSLVDDIIDERGP